MDEAGRHRRLTLRLLAGAALVGGVSLISAPALGSAPPSSAFTCVAQNVNECIVTIPLTSNMDEQVGSTMPDDSPWYLESAAGTGIPYTLSGPGAPQTYWNGVSGATQGTVWSALLTTGTVSPGGSAVITFEHVTPVTSKSYSSISVSHSTSVRTGALATVTSSITPMPPKGHVIVQRQNGSAWANIVSCAYSAKTKEWTGRFKWVFPAHTKRVFRVLATAAPGLLTTSSATFTISTRS